MSSDIFETLRRAGLRLKALATDVDAWASVHHPRVDEHGRWLLYAAVSQDLTTLRAGAPVQWAIGQTVEVPWEQWACSDREALYLAATPEHARDYTVPSSIWFGAGPRILEVAVEPDIAAGLRLYPLNPVVDARRAVVVREVAPDEMGAPIFDRKYRPERAKEWAA